MATPEGFTTRTIRADFDSPVSNVGIYYTSAGSNTILQAYNSNGAQIGQAIGVPNYGSTAPLVINQQNIKYIIISGFSGSFGGFSIDDLSFTTPSTNIPEFPSVVVPVAGVIGLLFVFGRKKAGM